MNQLRLPSELHHHAEMNVKHGQPPSSSSSGRMPPLDMVKVLSLDAEPVVGDKIVSFSVNYGVKRSTDAAMRWTVTNSFVRFKVLNGYIQKYAPKFIYSRFPKDGSLTSLRIRMSRKALENRRLMLELWIREVVANAELFPEGVQMDLWDFMKVPAKVVAVLTQPAHPGRLIGAAAGTPRHHDDGHSTDSDADPAHPDHRRRRSHNGAARHMYARRMLPPAASSPRSAAAPRTKSLVERFVRTVRKPLRNLAQKLVETMLGVLMPSAPEGAATVILGHNERMVTARAATSGMPGNTLQGTVVAELCAQAVTFVTIALVVFAADAVVGPWLCQRFALCLTATSKVLVTSVVMYLHMVSRDCDRWDGEAKAQPSYLKVQEHLRVFLDAPTFEYSDEVHSFPSPDDTMSDMASDDETEVWRDSAGVPNGAGNSRMEVIAALGGGSRGVFKGSEKAAKKLPVPLHDTLVPGSCFAKCEFNDVSKEARAMYTCRATTHPLKVRGETYLDDQKKVAPGPAMSKLMLLELYEVEAKDGDRHDHIVSRGKAKQRLEALRTLPEQLFFFILNFQIPGDPPVSIVSYFAVPLDLMERHPSRATAKFIEIFERFVDAPRTERERLAAWGVMLPPEPTTAGSLHELEEDDEEDDEPRAAQWSPDHDKAVNSGGGGGSGGNVVTASRDNSQSRGLHATSPPVAAGRTSFLTSPTSAAAAGGGSSSAGTSKTGRALKIMRGAAAVGGEGLKRMKNYLTGGEGGHNDGPVDGGAPLAQRSHSPEPASRGGDPVRRRSNSHQGARAPLSPRNGEPQSDDNGSSKRDSSMKGKSASMAVARGETATVRSISADGYSPVHGEASLHVAVPPAAHSPTGAALAGATSSSAAAAGGNSNSSAGAAGGGGGAWKIPSDITWPTAHDVGALPQSDFRNERFKLIPSITEGPWVVRAAVRATPALLGKKIVQRYFRGTDYLEIDCHVGSSVIASNIVGLCRGYAKQLINDCGVVIQGECPGELPECMLACVSLNHIDVNIRKKLDFE